MTNKPHLSAFPEDIYLNTFCGGTRSRFPGHSTYSETRRQRGYLYITSRNLGYAPPAQTCCSNQVKSLLEALQPESVTHG